MYDMLKEVTLQKFTLEQQLSLIFHHSTNIFLFLYHYIYIYIYMLMFMMSSIRLCVKIIGN